MTDITPAIAAALGFPKLKYVFVERERRWLCNHVPHERVRSAEVITDLYITGTRLRLREARPLDGGAPRLRLARKADVDAATRLITSIYLTEAEFALFAGLPGKTLRKVRHHVGPVNGVSMSADAFEGPLAGLILAEAEFDSAEALAAFPAPGFCIRDVTNDPRYRGGWLAANGLPPA